jgi:hypothetical protein
VRKACDKKRQLRNRSGWLIRHLRVARWLLNEARMNNRALLVVRWSKGDADLIYKWDGSKSDASLLNTYFEHVEYGGQTLRAHLEARGYDLTTLRFMIKGLP